MFFTDPQRLTSTATAKRFNPDLYACDIGEAAGKPTCSLSDVTPDHNGGESANVQGVVSGASENGNVIYYVATGVLAEGATPGADNLYVAQREGSEWATRFIATLSPEDSWDWGIEPANPRGPQQLNLSDRVSPSGQYLAFMSKQSLTGYDNTDVNEGPGFDEPENAVKHADEEVFLYNTAEGGTTKCVSCNPSHARPRGVFDTKTSGEGDGLLVDRVRAWESEIPGVDHWLAGSLPAWTRESRTEALYQSNYLDDKGRLYFMSADPLTPAAATERRKETIGSTVKEVGVENVYQYEPGGVGSCTEASGCISQISEGTANHESSFIDATSNGSNVFFATTDKSVPQDKDTALDIYDARECSEGCLAPVEPVEQNCQSTEECRPGSFPPPSNQVPASTTFVGPGNVLHNVPTGEVLPSKSSQPAAPNNAAKLAAALKKCRKMPHKTKTQKHKRAKCEAQAKKKYPVKAPKKASKKASKARRGGR